MQNSLKIPAILLAFIMLAACLAMTVSAADGVGYKVSPKLPANQDQSVKGYFNLRMRPGQKQELALVIKNQIEQDIVVGVEAYASTTSRTGDIQYLAVDKMTGYTPKYLVPEMIQFAETSMVVPANSEKEYPFTLTMPDEEFDGVLVGAIKIMREMTEQEENSGEAIINQYAYVIPIKLQETDATVEADFYLDSVGVDLVNHTPAVVCNVVNPLLKHVKGAVLEAKVYPEGSDTPILELASNELDMAPDSLMPLTIKETTGKGIPGGKYMARISVQYEGKEWNLEGEFEVTSEEAAGVSERAIYADDGQTAGWLNALNLPIWVLVCVSAGVVLVLVVVIVVILKKKQDKKYNELLEKMNKMDGNG